MDNPLINMQFIEGEFTWKNLEQAIEEFTKVCSTRCRNILIDHKEIPPIFYFLFKETKSGIYKVSFLPVPFANNEEKHMYVFFVKKLMEAIPKDKFEVDVKALMRGVYVIKIFNGYQVNIATEKIVVN